MIPLYKAEIDAGLGEKIRSNACLAYHAEIKSGLNLRLGADAVQAACAAIKQGKSSKSSYGKCPTCGEPGVSCTRGGSNTRITCGQGHTYHYKDAADYKEKTSDALAESFASHFGSGAKARLFIPEEMYTVSSILVSTTRNNNDDIFLPAEVWVARHSPSHKPGNINHNERKIIGHTVYTAPVTGDMSVENPSIQIMDGSLAIDELPDVYHLFNMDVIYTDWEDAEWKSEVMGVIGSIEMGKMCVSMECLFKGFDYGFTDASGNCRVVARNSETAWLSKHLRAYDGTGEYNGEKVGRVLRTLSFIGKGYTETPANPASIIFNHKNSVTFLPKSVSSVQHVTNIPENTMPTEAEKLAEAETKLAKSSEALADVQAKATQFEADAKKVAEKLVASEAKATELEASIEELKSKLAQAETDLAAMKEDKKKDEKKKFWEKRKAAILAAGLDEAAADAAATKYEAVADELFEDVLAGLVAKHKAASAVTEAEAAAKAKQAPAKTTTEVDLENAEETEKTAATDGVKVVEETDEAKLQLEALKAAVASTLKVKMEGKK